MNTEVERTSPGNVDERSGSDRRRSLRVTLAVGGIVQLAGGAELPCIIHDVSEHGIGITIDPSACRGAGSRVLVRCGDKVRLSFRVPGQQQMLRAGARVCRVWCQNAVVEMGLLVRRVNPQVLEALSRAGFEIDRRAPARGTRRASRHDLERLLHRVAGDVFPRLAASFEAAATADDAIRAGAFFRALVQIDAGKHDIAQRFVALALPRVVLDGDGAAAGTTPVCWRFDHRALAAAFCTACDLRDDGRDVRDVVEELVIAASFKHLAPPLATAAL